jgi:diacylglycerol kinase (ATP)
MERVLAIVNPKSGGQLGSQTGQWLSEIAISRGLQLTIRPTSMVSSAATLVMDARSFDRVIACGGDGTVTQVINGIVGTNVPLAIVPSGTGNVLAQAIGVRQDLRPACEAALGECDLLSLDLGLLNDSFYFALRLSVGYEALVTRDTTRELKTRFGKLAYLWQGALHGLRLSNVRYRIDVDGQSSRQRAESIWVANTGALGILGLELDPAINPSDRQLDLCIFRFSAAHDLQRIVRWLFKRERLPAAVVRRIPVKNYVNIVAASRQAVQIDGDTVGVTPCRIRVVPAAISVCIGARQTAG